VALLRYKTAAVSTTVLLLQVLHLLPRAAVECVQHTAACSTDEDVEELQDAPASNK
jgi:hypothetical protein